MRKMIVMAIVALFALNANAQKKEQKGLQGTWFATAQFGYAQTKTGNATNTNVMVMPIVGTFVQPTVAVGIAGGYVSMKAQNASTTAANTGLVVVEPLVRKYWGINGGLYFFGQLALPIISGKEKISEEKISQFGATASGGLDMILGKHFSVEFSYNLINASVATLTPKTGDKTTVTNISLAHVATVEDTYNGVLAGSNPTLTTPLSFGFKFLF